MYMYMYACGAVLAPLDNFVDVRKKMSEFIK